MTSSNDLYLIARKLRAQLEELRHAGVTSLPKASEADRQAWSAVVGGVRKQKMMRATEALREPEALKRQPSSRQQSSSPSALPPASARKAPSFDRPKNTPAPKTSSPSEGGSSLWTTIGSRPKKLAQTRASAPLKKASVAPPTTPPPRQVPPSRELPPVEEPGARFKEVSQDRHQVPEVRRPADAQTPSLLGEEWEEKHDPTITSRPLRGFDHTDSLQKRVSGLSKQEKLEFLRECLGDCEACKLHKGRKNIVFGEGDAKAPVVFVGEGPGYHEDRQGRPFVGKSGALLTRMIGAMGIERKDVYIANVVKCRPPDNRDPQPDEIIKCSPYLYKQLEAINPRVIVTLGRFATQTLLGSQAPMYQLRGRWQDWRQIPVLPTYHPAYLLRNEQKKRDAWQDLQKVMRILGLDQA